MSFSRVSAMSSDSGHESIVFTPTEGVPPPSMPQVTHSRRSTGEISTLEAVDLSETFVRIQEEVANREVPLDSLRQEIQQMAANERLVDNQKEEEYKEDSTVTPTPIAQNTLRELLKTIIKLSERSLNLLQDESLLDDVDELSLFDYGDFVRFGLLVLEAKKVDLFVKYYMIHNRLPTINMTIRDLRMGTQELLTPNSNLTATPKTTSTSISALDNSSAEITIKEHKVADISKFNGDWLSWDDWYDKVRSTWGNNGWLPTMESPINKILSIKEQKISNSGFYQLQIATANGQIANIVKQFEPPEGSCAFADGGGA